LAVRPRPAPRLLRLLAALGLLLLVVLGSARTVAAHAALLEMSPAAEETVAEPPSEVRLSFSEGVSVTPDSVRVFDPTAQELSGIEAVGQGSEVTAALPDLEQSGSYTVSWKVVSADGHPIRGAYLFHLGEPTLSEPVEAGAASTSRTSDVFRAVGAVLALGALVVCLAAPLAGARRAVGPRWWGLRWVPVVAGTMLLLGGALLSVGSDLGASVEVVLDTDSGRVAVAAVVLAVAGLVVSVVRVPPRTDVVLAVLTSAAIALQGHAVSLPPIWLSALATLVHVLAAVLWAAGLFWVEHRTRSAGDDELRADVVRLSPWGMGAVVALAATGVMLVLDRVPLDELLSSTYGRLSVLKLALLGVAVALAWRNRRSVDGDERADEEVVAGVAGSPGSVAGSGAATAVVAPARTPVAASLRTWVRAEMVVLALALIAGAALAQVPPPNESEAGVAGGMFLERQPFGDGDVEVTVEPGTRGVNEIHVIALAPDGRLMSEAEELVLTLELPSEEVGPLETELQPITAGHSSGYVRIPLEGEWTFTVTSRVDQFTELRAEFQVPIGR
jgi:copper transport protein